MAIDSTDHYVDKPRAVQNGSTISDQHGYFGLSIRLGTEQGVWQAVKIYDACAGLTMIECDPQFIRYMYHSI